jgi:hypothetical protein
VQVQVDGVGFEQDLDDLARTAAIGRAAKSASLATRAAVSARVASISSPRIACLVGKVLIERADTDAGELRDLVGVHRLESALGEQRVAASRMAST